MDKKIISVSAIAGPKLDVYSIQNDGELIHVYDAQLIRLLSQVFRVHCNIVLPSDGEIGVRLPDGNWTGMVGMAHRSEVDIAIGSVALTKSRFRAVNFSYPYFFSDFTFMTDKPRHDPTSLAILHPFPLIFWILLIAVIFSFPCILFIHVHRKQTYQNILFMLFGILLEKSISMQLRTLSLKLIMSTWLIFSFVIINSYKAVLLSILTFPPLTGIRNIPDLANAADENSITCYTYESSGLYQILLESEFRTWRSIGTCLQRNVLTSEDPEEAYMKASSNKAFITARSYLKPYKEKYFISEDSIFFAMHAFPISRNFCCQSYLNKKIHRLFAAGIFQKIENDEHFLLELNATRSVSTENSGLKILQLQNFKGGFIVLLSGYVVSTIVLFIEIAVKHYYPKLDVNFVRKRKKTLK